MQDRQDRPSTETESTPRPPAGENVKNLVTPGDDASAEAEAEEAVPGGEMPGADEAGAADTIEGDVARPTESDEARPSDPDEAQSPT